MGSRARSSLKSGNAHTVQFSNNTRHKPVFAPTATAALVLRRAGGLRWDLRWGHSVASLPCRSPPSFARGDVDKYPVGLHHVPTQGWCKRLLWGAGGVFCLFRVQKKESSSFPYVGTMEGWEGWYAFASAAGLWLVGQKFHCGGELRGCVFCLVRWGEIAWRLSRMMGRLSGGALRHAHAAPSSVGWEAGREAHSGPKRQAGGAGAAPYMRRAGARIAHRHCVRKRRAWIVAEL